MPSPRGWSRRAQPRPRAVASPRPLMRAYSWIVVLVLLLIAALLWHCIAGMRLDVTRPGCIGALADADPTPRDRLVALSA